MRRKINRRHVLALFIVGYLPVLVESFLATSTLCNRGGVRTSPQRTAAAASVDIHEGPFQPDDENFLRQYWGKKPLLIRQAFDKDTKVWPTRQDLIKLATDEREAGFSSRFIVHIPDKLESFDLRLGPFQKEPEFSKTLQTYDKQKSWTLLVNDVDRYLPNLDRWMDQHFSFLPRWRRDDAQISTAGEGGGIGPHVDNYDVFLIQTAGTRTWSVSSDTLTVPEEMDSMIPDIPVRILNLPNKERTEMVLEPGDMLYLPPRYLHCGTAKSGDCTTLSVGCRAPSAAELVARVAEAVQQDIGVAATKRFTDIDDSMDQGMLTNGQVSDVSLSDSHKGQMKKLVLDAVHSLLDDDDAWDQLVGGITTEATRYVEFPTTPYEFQVEDDEKFAEKWGKTPQEAIQLVKSDETRAFIRASGVSFATTRAKSQQQPVYRLYANGFHCDTSDDSPSSAQILHHIERGMPLKARDLDGLTADMQGFIEALVGEGYLVGVELDG